MFLSQNQVYTGYDRKNNMIIVSFKGTTTVANIIEDFHYFFTKYPYCTDCNIHKGMYELFKEVEHFLVESILVLALKYPQS